MESGNRGYDAGIGLESAAVFFRIFSKRVFLTIAATIGSREMSITAVGREAGIEPRRILPDLLRMVRLGIVCCRRTDKGILYRLKHPEFADALNTILGVSERRLIKE